MTVRILIYSFSIRFYVSDYSYYTAITFVSTYMIPVCLVFNALLKAVLLNFLYFAFCGIRVFFKILDNIEIPPFSLV